MPPPVGGYPMSPPPPPSAPQPAPVDIKNLKCPTCGAPLNAGMGEQVLTCEYCGGTVTLGGGGWGAVAQHTLLTASITDPGQALGVVKQHMDQGLFHHHDFEESQMASQKLTFVPFWVIPASATTNFTYQDMAVSMGGTMASVAAAEALGGAFGRNRGIGPVVPVFMGNQANATRQDSISGQYEFPIVAVRGLTQYQPKHYQFALPDRIPFAKGKVPGGAPLLNGDLGQEAAKQEARSLVTALQAEEAHKKHYGVSQINTNVEVGEGELLHAPIWQFTMERKGQQTVVLVDGHSNRVML